MKKFSAISLILSLLLCSSCVANKKDYGPWIENKEQIVKPEPEKEIIKRTVIGEEVNCGDGYWVHVWNENEYGEQFYCEFNNNWFSTLRDAKDCLRLIYKEYYDRENIKFIKWDGYLWEVDEE